MEKDDGHVFDQWSITRTWCREIEIQEETIIETILAIIYLLIILANWVRTYRRSYNMTLRSTLLINKEDARIFRTTNINNYDNNFLFQFIFHIEIWNFSQIYLFLFPSFFLLFRDSIYRDFFAPSIASDLRSSFRGSIEDRF